MIGEDSSTDRGAADDFRLIGDDSIQSEGEIIMDATAVMFLDCPAYMDADGAARCGLPAEIEHRYLMSSSDGPLESAKIRCPRGHWFNGPVEFLTWNKTQLRPSAAGARLRN